MNNSRLRIQLVSDSETIQAFSRVATADSVVTEPHELMASDQRFGIAEAAAVIAIVHTTAEIAELLVKSYKALTGQKKITVKTPKGSVTIEGDSSTPVDVVLKKLKSAGIL